MDSTDFEMPSPKRQKTESPVGQPSPLMNPSTETRNPLAASNSTEPIATATSIIPGLEIEPQPVAKTEEGNDMLDFLMQHVESEASARKSDAVQAVVHEAIRDPVADVGQSQYGQQGPAQIQQGAGNAPNSSVQEQAHPTTSTAATISSEDRGQPAALPPGLEPTATSSTDHLRAVAEVNGLPPTSDTLVSDYLPPATDTNPPGPEGREWETDSSPYDSSTDTDSSISSDSSDDSEDSDDEADDYALLDPYEQARILMAEDGGAGGSDEEDAEGGNSRTARSSGGAGLRTTNEKPEEVLPKPDITITDSMHVEELGAIEAIVENTALIRAKTTGEYQVLESGSVLCLPNRTVVGVVAETLGRVEQPMYTVRFSSTADIEESGVSEKGTKVCYVREHSSFVFTQPLKAVKGSDASNFHDEEVGDDEMEFSDDEKEAEYKRQAKLRRKGIDPDSVPSGGRGRGRGRDRGGRGGRGGGGRGVYNNGHMNSIPEASGDVHSNGAGEVEMNYDDVEDGETDYTPLRRPETIAAGGAMSPTQATFAASPSSQQQTGYQNNQSRGGYSQNQRRGRGRGNFNNNSRGRGRGGQNNNYNNNNDQRSSNYGSNNNNSNHPSNSYSQPSYQQQYQQPFPFLNFAQQAYSNQQMPGLAFQPPPPPPSLTPTTQTNSGNAFSPSPITPLPGGQFSFPNFPNMNMSMGQWPQPQQPQQNYSNNAEAIAQVQRQLEELRRNASNNGQQY
ncbi:hypothetical protein H2198_009043 [Neophaeococcomyces mojaviensis]|uniref:Uncharacterized protein n=1 Tax=Neophaeococcomyces mojaviensis TaxID=3383035 RepID=A0ACC2ZVK3_9EURO|nr:hypothetical protein H2198_009043 [Knufia sp. JES_112]